jgi:hypothetical protein
VTIHNADERQHRALAGFIEKITSGAQARAHRLRRRLA